MTASSSVISHRIAVTLLIAFTSLIQLALAKQEQQQQEQENDDQIVTPIIDFLSQPLILTAIPTIFILILAPIYLIRIANYTFTQRRIPNRSQYVAINSDIDSEAVDSNANDDNEKDDIIPKIGSIP
ncbi:hypothetical protein HDU76_001318, partial [Blyttiomyces sp. JEL0837]